MSEQARDLPRRLRIRLRCGCCGKIWQMERVASLFGAQGGLRQAETGVCPHCGAHKNHPDPARRRQPELVGLDESSEWVAFEAF